MSYPDPPRSMPIPPELPPQRFYASGPDPRAGRGSGAATWILAVLGVLLLGAAGLVGGVWWLFLRETPLLDAEVFIPTRAVVGEPIELVVTTTNPHAKPVTLDSIDIDLALLEGFRLVSVAPESNRTSEVPGWDQRIWAFGRSVPPGGELVVRYTLVPLGAGHFTGACDVCDPARDYTRLLLDVKIRDPSMPSP